MVLIQHGQVTPIAPSDDASCVARGLSRLVLIHVDPAVIRLGVAIAAAIGRIAFIVVVVAVLPVIAHVPLRTSAYFVVVVVHAVVLINLLFLVERTRLLRFEVELLFFLDDRVFSVRVLLMLVVALVAVGILVIRVDAVSSVHVVLVVFVIERFVPGILQ